MGQAQRQQHMAGVQGPGGTGASRGRADALLVQQQKQGFPFDALKAQVHVAGKAALPLAVENAVGNFRQAVDQPIPQDGDLGRVLLQMIANLVKGRSRAHDSGDILGAGPFAPLLRAAINHVHQGDGPAPDVQHTHSLGSMKLVGRQA
ncbi:hypothetical protein SDC9_76183 [bioreactor metagenome]|uniref:Uncharacterized protein n=1 Tax=bioreactor metagenome TaxID=1076179 RepID=A0A644YT46_9ZZZZ